MLTIRAVSFKGRPLDREVSARFEGAGGTIGRGESNTLVLPDPERFISRTHATVSFQAGGYVITDTGTKNPVVVNGRPLGSGSQARLGDGDQIKVGDYLLQVAVVAQAAPLGAPASPGPAAPIPLDPFADLLPTPERSVPRADPLIPPHAAPAAPSRSASGAPLIPEFPGSDPLAGIRPREQSIDELFGLKPSSASDLLAPDLPLGKPSGGPGAPGGVVDPLDILAGIVKPVPPPSVPDHGQELFTPYAPPVAKPDVAAKPESAARPEPAIRPEPMIRPEPALKPRADAAPPVPSPSARPAPSAQPAAPATQPVSVAPSGSQAELLRAFLQGAGISQIQAKSLT